MLYVIKQKEVRDEALKAEEEEKEETQEKFAAQPRTYFQD